MFIPAVAANKTMVARLRFDPQPGTGTGAHHFAWLSAGILDFCHGLILNVPLCRRQSCIRNKAF
jgi:hypothetical protein